MLFSRTVTLCLSYSMMHRGGGAGGRTWTRHVHKVMTTLKVVYFVGDLFVTMPVIVSYLYSIVTI